MTILEIQVLVSQSNIELSLATTAIIQITILLMLIFR